MGSFLMHENKAASIKEGSHQEDARGDLTVIECVIGGQTFAIDLFDTREVISRPEITPIPGTPDMIRGMTDLRGVVTTVIDLRPLLGIESIQTNGGRERVIILDHAIAARPLGFIVDRVSSVHTYQRGEFEPDQRNYRRLQKGVIKKSTLGSDGKNRSELVIILHTTRIIENVQEYL